MRIGIDARVMYPEASGIGRFTTEIVKSLSKLNESNNHEFLLYTGERTEKFDLPSNWKFKDVKISSRGILRSFLFSYIARNDDLDIFYSADYLGPICRMRCKTIMTVYDLIPIVCPDMTSLSHRIVGRYLLPASIKRADYLISISGATKSDMVKYLKTAEKKIKTIHLGKNDLFYSINKNGELLEEVKKKYGIGNRLFLLFTGSLDRRKNLSNILKAFSQLDMGVRKDYALVLAGNIDKEDPVFNSLLEGLKIKEYIIITGFIEDKYLSALYQGARAFCFPSLYEGFGLPVLEAMTCGCPVITSNVSSLPEVAGGAAILVDPRDVSQISDAMKNLIVDDKLHTEMRKRSIEQAKNFSWEKAAGELLDLFLSI